VFEDVHGGAWRSASMLSTPDWRGRREGLGPDVVIDADAAGALGRSSGPHDSASEIGSGAPEQEPEQEIGHRP